MCGRMTVELDDGLWRLMCVLNDVSNVVETDHDGSLDAVDMMEE